jgi:hypothetical protein
LHPSEIRSRGFKVLAESATTFASHQSDAWSRLRFELMARIFV